jgi:hypothetical protein
MSNQESIMQFFAYEHLPEQLQEVSKPFGDLARGLVDTLPRNPERTVALRKLLEAKDAAVRAKLFKSHVASPDAHSHDGSDPATNRSDPTDQASG